MTDPLILQHRDSYGAARHAYHQAADPAGKERARRELIDAVRGAGGSLDDAAGPEAITAAWADVLSS